METCDYCSIKRPDVQRCAAPGLTHTNGKPVMVSLCADCYELAEHES